MCGDATYACLFDLCSIDRCSFRVDMLAPASRSSSRSTSDSCPGSPEGSFSLTEYRGVVLMILRALTRVPRGSSDTSDRCQINLNELQR